jgi:hypothetical protein
VVYIELCGAADVDDAVDLVLNQLDMFGIQVTTVFSITLSILLLRGVRLISINRCNRDEQPGYQTFPLTTPCMHCVGSGGIY